ncbi:MAG: alpha-glucosidase C-terminal domain-containing protein [Lachnospiraceae bacterium]|nr:alpha-glucosidase C-terminal domain-containing protein [Lachnospiraceae bacterium]
MKKTISLLLSILLLTGCTASGGSSDSAAAASEVTGSAASEGSVSAASEGTGSAALKEDAPAGALQMKTLAQSLPEGGLSDPYRSTYEVFVYSFADSDGDGIGDLKGLAKSLDYINDGVPGQGDDLGCGRIWLMPVFPSPTYHKYDTTDYMNIDPQYGTLADFDDLLSLCHERNVDLILDLAFNHTSVDHPWFAEAAKYLKNLAPGEDPVKEDCPYVWYYTFSREPYSGYAALPDSEWYYEARFWEGMPDLNLETPEVREELKKVLSFWLDRGVDGFRLDALTSYYTDNREASISFTDWVADTVHEIDPDAYIVGECWTSMEDYARFYETDITSLFDFAFAGQEGIISEVTKGTRSALAFGEAMEEEEALFASFRPNAVNAPFYTNHDMARGTGYYAYDDGTRTKFALGLNTLQTGSAFLYYGEELGMKGSGKDENKRAPMYWITDEEVTAAGDSAAAGGGSENTFSPQELKDWTCAGPADMDSFSMKFGSYAAQSPDPASILSYVRNALRIREAFPVLAEGRTHVLKDISGQQVLAFTRTGDGMDPLLVLVNSSDQEQTLDLAGTDSSGFGSLSAVLSAQGEKINMSGTTVTLPPFGIAFLTES